jgi:hypothetical protein
MADFGITEIGLALSALSAAMSVAGGIASANTEKQNSLNAEADADLAVQQGQSEADRQRAITRASQAKLVAESGAQGTTLTGSPMEVYLANAKQGEIEAQDKVYAGNLKARGLKAQAGMYNRQATSSLIGGTASGVGTLGSTLIGSYGKKATTKVDPNAGADTGDLY